MFRWSAVLLLVGIALLTNRWVSWAEGIELLSVHDVQVGYQPIAEAAPSFPSGSSMHKHVAQRFFFPYVIGLLAGLFRIPIPALFFLVSIFAEISILLVAAFLMERLGVPPGRRLTAIGLLIFQPYAFRYYWIAPGMVTDLIFVMGMTLAINGMFLSRPKTLVAGVLVSALARQTVTMLLPFIFFYLWRAPQWRAYPVVLRAALVGVLGMACSVIFLVTGRITTGFSIPTEIGESLLGLKHWMESPGFSISMLAEHILRCLLPLAAVSGLILAQLPWTRRFDCLVLLFLSAAVASQPILAGPVITGQNGGRLSTMALLPLAICWAISGNQEGPAGLRRFLLVLMFLGSFHHLYTIVGPSGPMATAALQMLIAAVLVGTVAYNRLRPSRLVAS